MRSTLGLSLAAAYLGISTFLILSQGLFGESFIAILLGVPWSFLFSYFEYWQASSPILTLLLLAPIGFNTYLFYMLGKLIGCKSTKFTR